MKRGILSVALVVTMSVGGWGIGYGASDHGSHGQMDHGSHFGPKEMDHGSRGDQGKMDHGEMAGTFTHEAVVDGIQAEFQVMTLASMNMKDPDGNTHHVMAKFFDEKTKEQMNGAIGKIKVIPPLGESQEAELKNYGGVFAANFTVKDEGKHGIICLFKIEDKKRIAKFWYHPE